MHLQRSFLSTFPLKSRGESGHEEQLGKGHLLTPPESGLTVWLHLGCEVLMVSDPFRLKYTHGDLNYQRFLEKQYRVGHEH